MTAIERLGCEETLWDSRSSRAECIGSTIRKRSSTVFSKFVELGEHYVIDCINFLVIASVPCKTVSFYSSSLNCPWALVFCIDSAMKPGKIETARVGCWTFRGTSDTKNSAPSSYIITSLIAAFEKLNALQLVMRTRICDGFYRV